MFRQLSSTSYPINFFMVLASDHVTPATGLTPVVTLSKNGAAFGAASGAVTEISSGWYSLAGDATDRGTLGELLIHAAVATADNTDLKVLIVTNDVFAALATPTNITGGTITTVTNLTNAPTAGDLTAAMKTSLNAATPASVQNISAQTGDSYARIGAAGAGLTNIGTSATCTNRTNVPTALDQKISDIPGSVWSYKLP